MIVAISLVVFNSSFTIFKSLILKIKNIQIDPMLGVLFSLFGTFSSFLLLIRDIFVLKVVTFQFVHSLFLLQLWIVLREFAIKLRELRVPGRRIP